MKRRAAFVVGFAFALAALVAMVGGAPRIPGAPSTRSRGKPDPSEELPRPRVLHREEPSGMEERSLAGTTVSQKKDEREDGESDAYRGRSLEQLESQQTVMAERFHELKRRTDALSARRSQLLAQGQRDEADRVLAEEIAPAFEERKRLAMEATLLARAKIQRRGEAMAAQVPR